MYICMYVNLELATMLTAINTRNMPTNRHSQIIRRWKHRQQSDIYINSYVYTYIHMHVYICDVGGGMSLPSHSCSRHLNYRERGSKPRNTRTQFLHTTSHPHATRHLLTFHSPIHTNNVFADAAAGWVTARCSLSCTECRECSVLYAEYSVAALNSPGRENLTEPKKRYNNSSY